jgi:methionine-rich copper-binding protein CopC
MTSRAERWPRLALALLAGTLPKAQKENTITMSKSKNMVMRLALALAMMLALGLSLNGTASAHAKLTASTPSDGETLTAEPASVSATFGEDVSVAQSYMKVYFTGGSSSNVEIDNGDGKPDVNNRKNMNVTLKSGMGDGSYTVKWHTVTEDDNGIVDGSFSFTVKSAGTASGPTGQVGTMQEAGGDSGSTTSGTSSTLPTTGNSLEALALFTAALGAFALIAGLSLRRVVNRR